MSAIYFSVDHRLDRLQPDPAQLITNLYCLSSSAIQSAHLRTALTVSPEALAENLTCMKALLERENLPDLAAAFG